MIGRRPDILTEVPLRRRREREEADARYLTNQGIVRTASQEALARDFKTWVGLDVYVAEFWKTYEATGDPLDAVVAARVDLDHPIYFANNRFTRCEDCGCDLQYRPDVISQPGQGVPFLCICCAARRLREQEK